MKVKGALWKQFYNDEVFWAGHYHDDVLITFDGEEQEDYDNPADDAEVKIESGYVYKEEDGIQLRHTHDVTLVSFFRKWKKIQSTETLVITVEKQYAEQLRHQIGNLYGVKGVK